MRREVGTASRFDHPNVLTVYGVIEADWCLLGGIVTPVRSRIAYKRVSVLTVD
jgi:hypothetical protein